VFLIYKIFSDSFSGMFQSLDYVRLAQLPDMLLIESLNSK